MSRVRPDGSLRDGHWSSQLRFVSLLRVCLPVLRGVAELGLTSGSKHVSCLGRVNLGTSRVGEQRGIVHEFVLNYRGRELVVTRGLTY